MATVVGYRARARALALAAVFGGSNTEPPWCSCRMRQIVRVASSRSTSGQHSPAASPRRNPRSATRYNSGRSSSFSMAVRNRDVSAAVQTATLGRGPPAFQAATRAGVHTTGCGRRRGGSSTQRAGSSVTNPSRIAPFRTARNVHRMLCSVGADRGLPSAWRLPADREEHGAALADRQPRQRNPVEVRQQVQAQMRLIHPPGVGPQRDTPDEPVTQPAPRHPRRRARSGAGRLQRAQRLLGL